MSVMKENPHPTEDEARHALQGVLCRCGTYTHVTRAVAAMTARP